MSKQTRTTWDQEERIISNTAIGLINQSPNSPRQFTWNNISNCNLESVSYSNLKEMLPKFFPSKDNLKTNQEQANAKGKFSRCNYTLN